MAIGSEYGSLMEPQSLPRPPRCPRTHTTQQRRTSMRLRSNMDPSKTVPCQKCHQEESGVTGISDIVGGFDTWVSSEESISSGIKSFKSKRNTDRLTCICSDRLWRTIMGEDSGYLVLSSSSQVEYLIHHSYHRSPGTQSSLYNSQIMPQW